MFCCLFVFPIRYSYSSVVGTTTNGCSGRRCDASKSSVFFNVACFCSCWRTATRVKAKLELFPRVSLLHERVASFGFLPLSRVRLHFEMCVCWLKSCRRETDEQVGITVFHRTRPSHILHYF